jgi:ABC-type lipoprotein release transport system permease subunit
MFVDMLPLILILQVLCLVLLATFSAVIPARRAAEKNIVDALGHI